ncbi:NTP pyrophosphatase, house-cleaning of non-canonical NTPs [Amphibacillus marinus]|uniref:NTP pyrophosphatase, house-cleaning of non-canonical NTPs n=1 Tax=Amphibacillus marinus TaxID=872970 RepID=A0A1H8T1A5_9BACI|nr:MazG-like family protein [Amphibacillus marinus]SEO84605.1 NTP pyrophosphatase, house-cleaning of non-canonical NTPs [Amphibacillus marinus]
MNILSYQHWVTDFYKKRSWYELDTFIRINFLTEEVGEVSRAVRALEIGRDRPDEDELSRQKKLENLKEELGDVLDNLFILADKYGISMTQIVENHKEKLVKRYNDN